jgi:hypothetical protein
MILMIFFAVIVAGLLTVVVDVSTVFLGQRALQAVADGAAAAGAQRADIAAVYSGTARIAADAALPLSANDASSAIDAYLAVPAHHPHQCATGSLRVSRLSVNGPTVDLSLSCRVPWPFVSFVVGDEVGGHEISMSAQARLVVRPPAPNP